MAELQSEWVFDMSLDPGEVQDVGMTPSEPQSPCETHING